LQDGTNRHATHPVNAMLNYAYAVLESQVRIAVVSQGLDPTIGYLHASKKRRVALVYDLMEPLRSQVDRRVLDFAREHMFSPADFVITERGVCRLHPQLARRVADLLVSREGIETVVREAAAALMPRDGEPANRKRSGAVTLSGLMPGRPSRHGARSAQGSHS